MINYLIEHNRYLNIIGIFVILGITYLFSKNRKAIDFKLVLNALLMQITLAFLVLKTRTGMSIVQAVADAINNLYGHAQVGISFVFGALAEFTDMWGVIFAIRVLPVVIFFGAFMGLLFYLGIIQRVVNLLSLLIRPLLGTSGAETLCAIANSFLGQTEAPLVIRNYLCTMTKSELLVVMLSGMGTISGSILVIFAAMGVPAVHMLTASIMAIPTTIMLAKILYPQTEKATTAGGAQAECKTDASNVFDAVSLGTIDGLHLALNIGAMLISFLALIALINGVLGWSSGLINSLLTSMHSSLVIPILSLEKIFSIVFAPFAYLLGFTGSEALQAGELIGTKVAINELVAYKKMVTLGLSERTQAIITYALCGFSNFSCIGIQIGGIGALVPEKRQWISELGLTALFGAVLANLLSAMVIALIL